MMRAVSFTPEAQTQLIKLYQYIEAEASHEIAARFTDGIMEYCNNLQTFPHRGAPRDDIKPGLRITNYRKRTIIAFKVNPDQIAIIGIFHGGQDYQSILEDDPAPQ